MAMLLGKKVGMTQVYNEQGAMVSVTVIQAGPCCVLQKKSKETDGYNGIQLGYEEVKPSRVKKPMVGHCQKANTSQKKFIREWRLNDGEEVSCELGGLLDVTMFEGVEYVDVVGTSKGKGYAGVMKRHNFGGFPGSHGTERKHRAPGSIGSHASDRGHGGNLKKGKKMSGRMGGERVTSRNHSLVSVDKENNLLVIKGAVAGPAGGYVVVRTSQKNKK